MTGSEFLTYVKRIFKRTDKDTEIYEATTDMVVDMSLRLLSDLNLQISSTLSGISSAGDYILDVPSDFGHLVGEVLVRETDADDTYTPLEKISKNEYDNRYHEATSVTASNRQTGIPRHFTYFGQKIYIGPPVDKATYSFKVNYSTDNVTDIVAGTTTVPFTDKYRKILRDGVLSLMFQHVEQFEESSVFQSYYVDGLNAIMANDHANMKDYAPIAYQGV